MFEGPAVAHIIGNLPLTPGSRLGRYKRVAVLTAVEPSGAPVRDNDVVFLLNFFDELRAARAGAEMRQSH